MEEEEESFIPSTPLDPIDSAYVAIDSFGQDPPIGGIGHLYQAHR